jgi:hypothetical protein
MTVLRHSSSRSSAFERVASVVDYISEAARAARVIRGTRARGVNTACKSESQERAKYALRAARTAATSIRRPSARHLRCSCGSSESAVRRTNCAVSATHGASSCPLVRLPCVLEFDWQVNRFRCIEVAVARVDAHPTIGVLARCEVFPDRGSLAGAKVREIGPGAGAFPGRAKYNSPLDLPHSAT